jgi:hypothetical protein
MPELTSVEADVLEVVRKGGKEAEKLPFPSGVPTWWIRSRVAAASYDQADRALSSLVAKGLIFRPKRGFYMPTSEIDTAIREIDHAMMGLHNSQASPEWLKTASLEAQEEWLADLMSAISYLERPLDKLDSAVRKMAREVANKIDMQEIQEDIRG